MAKCGCREPFKRFVRTQRKIVPMNVPVVCCGARVGDIGPVRGAVRPVRAHAGQADAAAGWPFAFATGAQSARGVSGRYRDGPADRGPGNRADRRRDDVGRDGECRLACVTARGRQKSRCFGVCPGGVDVAVGGGAARACRADKVQQVAVRSFAILKNLSNSRLAVHSVKPPGAAFSSLTHIPASLMRCKTPSASCLLPATA